MKLTIENLGRIEHAEIDVRPLTVFIGPNGTNKTWTAYSLYGLLRTLSRGPATTLNLWSNRPDVFPGIVSARVTAKLDPAFALLDQDTPPARVVAEIQAGSLFAGIRDEFLHYLTSQRICQLLGADEANVAASGVKFGFGRGEFARLIQKITVIFEKPANRISLVTTLAGSDVATETVLTGVQWDRTRIMNDVMAELWNLIDNVVVLPAERNGIIVTMNAMAVQSEQTLLPAHRDFLQFLRLAMGMQKSAGGNGRAVLSGHLASVVGGEIVVAGEGGERRLVFKLPNGRLLPLASASSLSRGVAGLSLYLDHFVKPNDVLVIDEIEMNAHPEAQMALIEIIAMIVSRGVRVILTTHSPYVVDHLNNLMEAATLPLHQQETIAAKFALKSREAFISADNVAACTFEEKAPDGKVEVTSVLDRGSGLIDWTTFGRVSTRISSLFGDLLEASKEDE